MTINCAEGSFYRRNSFALGRPKQERVTAFDVSAWLLIRFGGPISAVMLTEEPSKRSRAVLICTV